MFHIQKYLWLISRHNNFFPWFISFLLTLIACFKYLAEGISLLETFYYAEIKLMSLKLKYRC